MGRLGSTANQHHFTCAPGIEPVIDESQEKLGAVIGEEPWMPIRKSDLDLVGLPLFWLGWRDRPFAAPKLLDHETVKAVVKDVWGK
jgi:hypothetical protein